LYSPDPPISSAVCRLVTRTTFGALTLAGIRTGGEFVYLRAQQPTGFFVGTITRAAATAMSGVLVTSDSVSVADVTAADGRYLVAGRIGVDSLRAVEKCAQHPGKMWIVRCQRMFPLLPFGPEAQPWHSTPYQALPPVYVQNASLEIAWTRVVRESRSIAGDVLVPFLTEGYEGFDINDSYDWMVAERLLADGLVQLPTLGVVGSRR